MQLSRKLVVTFGTACYGTALGLLWLFKKHCGHVDAEEFLPRFPPENWLPPELAVSWLCYVIALLFGLSDAAWNTQIIAALGSTTSTGVQTASTPC